MKKMNSTFWQARKWGLAGAMMLLAFLFLGTQEAAAQNVLTASSSGTLVSSSAASTLLQNELTALTDAINAANQFVGEALPADYGVMQVKKKLYQDTKDFIGNGEPVKRAVEKAHDISKNHASKKYLDPAYAQLMNLLTN